MSLIRSYELEVNGFDTRTNLQTDGQQSDYSLAFSCPTKTSNYITIYKLQPNFKNHIRQI